MIITGGEPTHSYIYNYTLQKQIGCFNHSGYHGCRQTGDREGYTDKPQ